MSTYFWRSFSPKRKNSISSHINRIIRRGRHEAFGSFPTLWFLNFCFSQDYMTPDHNIWNCYFPSENWKIKWISWFLLVWLKTEPLEKKNVWLYFLKLLLFCLWNAYLLNLLLKNFVFHFCPVYLFLKAGREN